MVLMMDLLLLVVMMHQSLVTFRRIFTATIHIASGRFHFVAFDGDGINYRKGLI